MTRNFSKISAALLAALTISAAAIATADSASARMMGGERMGRMGHMGHMGHGRMGHMGRGMGFGRGMAIGMGVGLVGALVAANVAANQPYAESFNPQTGERIRSEGPRGRHVITKTTADGKVAVEGGGKAPPKVKKGKEPASASATDTQTGETTSVVDNQNGSRTISKTDKTGKVTDKWIEQNKNPDSASSFDPESGITTLR